MAKYRIRENELRNLVREAIDEVVIGGKTQHSQKESRSRRGSRLYESKSSDDIRQAYELLNGVVNSGFIPFSSPSPSSTEVVIKRSVMRAMDELMKAMDACRDCGY